MPAYSEKYPVGTSVRIVSLHALKDFQKQWKYHHPLSLGQLEYAEQNAEVISVGFYHGGDVLYELKGIPGIWYEVCLDGETTSSRC